MKKASAVTIALLLCLLPVLCAGQEVSERKFASVRGYDPSRNAEQDLLDAQAEARRSGRNVLVEVGGKWCSWCRIMDRLFEEHPDLKELRDENYVTVPVNFSPENENRTLLGRYPKVQGYPHLFVLDADGKLLRSQNTAELESGKGYNIEKFRRFLQQWAPAKAGSQ